MINFERAVIEQLQAMQARLQELERAPVPRALGGTLGTKFGAPVVTPWIFVPVNNADAPGSVSGLQNVGGLYTELAGYASAQLMHSYWGNSTWLLFNHAHTGDPLENPSTAGTHKYTANTTTAFGMVFDANSGLFSMYMLPAGVAGANALPANRIGVFSSNSTGTVSLGSGSSSARINGALLINPASVGGTANIYVENSGTHFQMLTGGGLAAKLRSGEHLISDDYGIAITHWLTLRYDSAGKPGTNTWSVISDGATKRNVKQFARGAAWLKQLPQRVEFEYNGEHDTPAGMRGVGYIAQELEAVAPEMVETHTVPKWIDDPASPGVQKQDGVQQVKYTNTGDMIHIHTNVLLELIERVERLEARLQGGTPPANPGAPAAFGGAR